ncbi:Crp/Fnr family transcriptional regulator [Flavobacterium sp. LaA7.5]|nr:Crp/Fnr family transcriptional regulator [Flavobacterium salilacus subsp. altitudinum]
MKTNPTEVLKQHIIARLGDNIANLETVLSNFDVITLKRNAVLLQQGEICRYVYFVAKGSLQVYAYDKDGNETTRDIITEGNWCSELISFGSGNPANENIRTIEPCELLAISREGFGNMMASVPQFDIVYKQILEASYANSVYRVNTFVSLSALERIQWLMEYRPKLMARFSSKLIASYLGITKETFSRLKGKL